MNGDAPIPRSLHCFASLITPYQSRVGKYIILIELHYYFYIYGRLTGDGLIFSLSQNKDKIILLETKSIMDPPQLS